MMGVRIIVSEDCRTIFAVLFMEDSFMAPDPICSQVSSALLFCTNTFDLGITDLLLNYSLDIRKRSVG